jgi:hypothetical protein
MNWVSVCAEAMRLAGAHGVSTMGDKLDTVFKVTTIPGSRAA